MYEALTPEQQEAVKAFEEQQETVDAMAELSEATASELGEGKSKETIVKELTKQDWPEDQAIQFVDDIQQALDEHKDSLEIRNALASGYERYMLHGVLWAGGGAIVTVVTYAAASGGGTYVVASGAILFGVVYFFRGLFGWFKYKD